MNYHIYCKEKFISDNYKAAIAEFEKRLSAYCEVSLYISETLSVSKDIAANNHHFIIVTSGKSTYSSEEFSELIKELQLSGKSNVHIFIGYSEVEFYEVFSSFKDIDTPRFLSITASSLPVQTIGLLFCEQLYRAYTILQGKTYHK